MPTENKLVNTPASLPAQESGDNVMGFAGIQASAGIGHGAEAGRVAERGADRGAAPLIVHCHLRWDFVWQRPQQIFSRLAADRRILFIEEPMFDVEEARIDFSEPYSNVIRAVPRLPQSLLGSVDAQCEAVLPLLKVALAEHPLLAGRFAHPVQWFYSPMPAPKMLDQFNAQAVVYDCMDELANFRFAPKDILERERLVLSRADLVFTGGYRLYESKSRYHSNVHFYGCGVDVAHYGKARAPETELPAEVSGLPRPIFGYFGVIDERLDYGLIQDLARANPEASVVMAGPVVKVDPNELPKEPNIYWLGQRPYEELPALVKSFDVCLMPFALNEATAYINPTKTLEYMAGGKPIVSSAVPDVVRNFTPIVQVAHSSEEFIAATQQQARRPDAALIAQGIEMANKATWENTVAEMSAHVAAAVAVNEAKA